MRRFELTAMLLSLVLVAGCATVPTSGAVEHYQPQQGGSSSGVQVAPLPPADGASQLLVVEGFLHAMSTYEAGYQVARQYLSVEADKRWHPESGVQVYADGYPPTETDQSVVLIAPLAGAIDASGVYRPAGGQVRQDFGLVKNQDGQWRISNPPVGLLVSKYLFTTGFTSVTVHFAAASGGVLLPDPRYFPAGEGVLADAVSAVLAGPSPWLAPIITAQSSNDVVLDSVEVDSTGLVRVALGGAAIGLTKERRDDLLAELVYTLNGLDQVRAVQVSAGAGSWTNDAGAFELSPADFSERDPGDSAGLRLAFLARGDKLQRQVTQGNWTDFIDAQASLPKLQELAVSRGTERWAGLTEGRTKLVDGGLDDKGSRTLRVGSGLLRPFYSRTGELWSPSTQVGGLRVYRDGAAVQVTVRGVPNRQVVAAALAPDGARLVLVLAKGGVTTVGLMRVRQLDTGLVVDGWQELNLSLLAVTSSRVLDIGWNSVTDLALLRVDTDKLTSVTVVSQDGAELNDIGPSDAAGLESLAVVPGRPALAKSTSGVLSRFDGEFNWLVSATDVDAAAYSG